MKKKNNKNNKMQTTKSLPTWNLADLYSSISSKKIIIDLKYIEKYSKSFAKKYEGKIIKLNSKALFNAILDLEKIDVKMDKILSYAYLLVAENADHEINKIFFQQMQEKITNYSSALIFFTLELNQIDEKKLNTLLKNVELSEYKTWIKNRRTFKPYQLDKNLEKLLQDKNITSSSAWVRLFDETIAALRFPYKNKNLTSAEILNYLSDNKSSARKMAAKSVGKILGKNVKIFSTITNTLAKDKSINDDWRKLPNPVSSRNLSNVVEDEVVEALSKTVKNFDPLISLDGGQDGLKCYKEIAQDINRAINKNGRVILEIGYNQAYDVIKIFESKEFKLLKIYNDINGLNRILTFESKKT